MKIVAIIQARMKSQRLPGKVMLSLMGKPVLWHVINRVCESIQINEVIIATTSQSEDDPIEHLFETMINANVKRWQGKPIHLYRGNAEDIMDRMSNALRAITTHGENLIVEITADCPLIDPWIISEVVSQYLHYPMAANARVIIATNIHPRTWPDGLDVIAYPRHCLEKINGLVTDPILRHHVGWNMLQRSNWTVLNYEAPPRSIYRWPKLGLVLDEYEDYQTIEHLYHKFQCNLTAKQAIAYLHKYPEYIYNKHVRRKVPEEG